MASERMVRLSKAKFNELYDKYIIGAHQLEDADYYNISRERYWQSLGHYAALDLPEKAQVLEIGGGQIAILASHMFGDEAIVGDVGDDFRAPLDAARVGFEVCDLVRDDPANFKGRFHAIVMLEVIEHIPIPAHVILAKLRTWLKPHGALLLTTPNLFRIRNLVRMAAGRDVFDRFELPIEGVCLGHQLEYSADHLAYQIERAGFRSVRVDHDQLGQTGHSLKARIARRVLAPLRLRPKWRDGLVAVAINV